MARAPFHSRFAHVRVVTMVVLLIAGAMAGCGKDKIVEPPLRRPSPYPGLNTRAIAPGRRPGGMDHDPEPVHVARDQRTEHHTARGPFQRGDGVHLHSTHARPILAHRYHVEDRTVDRGEELELGPSRETA